MFTKRPVRNGVATRQDINPKDETAQRDRLQARSGYMAELEAWLDKDVYEPIKAAIAARDSKELHIAFNEATVQIKRKVLASYHNGLKARKNG